MRKKVKALTYDILTDSLDATFDIIFGKRQAIFFIQYRETRNTLTKRLKADNMGK